MKTNRTVRNLEQVVLIDGQVFEGIQSFRYLST